MGAGSIASGAGSEVLLLNRSVLQTIQQGKARAQISFNFMPKYAAQVVDMLLKLTGDSSDFVNIIDCCKIYSPPRLGRRVDCAIIYLKYDPGEAQRLALCIARQLDNALISHVPAGMHELHAGINYAELVLSQRVSYGDTLSMVLARALSRVSSDSIDLYGALNSSLAEAGLNPVSCLLAPASRVTLLEGGCEWKDRHDKRWYILSCWALG